MVKKINKKNKSNKTTQKKSTSKPTTHQKPIKSDITRLDVYYDVSIKVSDKSFAERIQRAISEKCGFNAEILTQAR